MADMLWRPVFHCGDTSVYNKGVRHLVKLRSEDGDLTRALTPLSWKWRIYAVLKYSKGLQMTRGLTPLSSPITITLQIKGVSPLGGHLIETQEKEMLTWLLYLIWMESFWTQSN